MNEVLERFDLPYREKMGKADEVNKWMTMIGHFKLEDRLVDKEGYLSLRWVIDNPPPRDYEAFIEWVKKADNRLSDIKEQHRRGVKTV